MSESSMKRRDFAKLTFGALSGLAAGLTVDSQAEHHEKEKDKDKKDNKKKVKLSVAPALLLEGPNVCKRLNVCKGKGKSGDNACAGQSVCATAEKHSCAGQEACKGQGGCGGYPGQNTCKGKGHCAVPLNKKSWELARKQFKQVMKDVEKKVGNPPSKD